MEEDGDRFKKCIVEKGVMGESHASQRKGSGRTILTGEGG